VVPGARYRTRGKTPGRKAGTLYARYTWRKLPEVPSPLLGSVLGYLKLERGPSGKALADALEHCTRGVALTTGRNDDHLGNRLLAKAGDRETAATLEMAHSGNLSRMRCFRAIGRKPGLRKWRTHASRAPGKPSFFQNGPSHLRVASQSGAAAGQQRSGHTPGKATKICIAPVL